MGGDHLHIRAAEMTDEEHKTGVGVKVWNTRMSFLLAIQRALEKRPATISKDSEPQ